MKTQTKILFDSSLELYILLSLSKFVKSVDHLLLLS